MARSFARIGATVMGRNMFGPIRGPWDTPDGEAWRGWWGENPPYHHPVFVLTHHAHEPIEMEGGTTFLFVTDGIESALEQARDAAGEDDIRLSGGAATVREYLRAGLVDELNIGVAPVLLGAGERIFDDLGDALARYEVEMTAGRRRDAFPTDAASLTTGGAATFSPVGRRGIVTIVLTFAFVLVPATAFAKAGKTPTTTTPADYRTALTQRLAKEYDDAALAKQVVTGLSADTLASVEARVPAAEVATSPFLAYTPPRVAAKNVDSLVVFAFGNRIGDDGDLQAGPTNEALAKVVFRFVIKHPMPVYAQTEIATLLQAAGVQDVTSIDAVTAPDGTVTYLSTAGVADQVMTKAQAAGAELGTVGVVGFADHAVRCVLTARKAGMTDAAVPKGVKLPAIYDPDSNQSWTRTRAAYLPTDLIGRLTTL